MREKQGDIHLRSILKEKELWFLLFLGILYFHRPLFLKETFFFRDLLYEALPWQQLLADLLRNGELPLWDPYTLGGRPYLANISNGTLSPSSLLYVWLPFLTAFNLKIVAHFLGCSIVVYFFARVVSLSPLSSFIAGLLYTFCGYTLSVSNLPAMFFALPYLPLLLLCWHLYLSERRRRWFALCVVSGVFQVFAPGPEVNVITMLFLLGWALWYPYRLSFFRRVGLWILLGIFILGIASVQILPTLELAQQSARGEGIHYAEFSRWSLPFKRLPELFFPEFFGYVDTIKGSDYWGWRIVDREFPFIFSIYFGCALLLACWGGWHHQKTAGTEIIPLRVRRFLLGAFICGLLLSFGRFLPGFKLLYTFFPPIRIFRLPTKFLFAGILPFSLLAAYTAELHFGKRTSHFEGPSVKFVLCLWGILAALLMLTLSFWFSDRFAETFQRIMFESPGSEVARSGLKISFLHTTGIWFILTLLYQARIVKHNAWQHWLLALLLVVDLFSTGRRVAPSVPQELLTGTPPLARLIADHIGEGKLFRTQDPYPVVLTAPSDHIIWRYRWRLEVLSLNFGTLYKIPVITSQSDVGGFTPKALMKLEGVIRNLGWEQRLPFLSARGVTLILTPEEIALPGVQRIAGIPNASNVSFFLYKNTTAMRPVEFVNSWDYTDSDTRALYLMAQPGYDPRKQVVLQQAKSSLFEYYEAQSSLPELSPSACESSHVELVKRDFHSSSLRVSNNCDGFLVFSEPFYPGWRISVDNEEAPMLRANYVSFAVFLPAGEHEIEKVYRPRSVWIGMLCSLFFCGMLSLFTVYGSLSKSRSVRKERGSCF